MLVLRQIAYEGATVTWHQQVAEVKRQLAGKTAHGRKRWKRNGRESRAGKVQCAPVIVGGEVSQEFVERMRTMGVRVVNR